MSKRRIHDAVCKARVAFEVRKDERTASVLAAPVEHASHNVRQCKKALLEGH